MSDPSPEPLPTDGREYRWPRKVERYGLTCPFQRFLVAAYEGLVDWKRHREAWNGERLDVYVREHLLADLKPIQPDPENSDTPFHRAYYIREVNPEKLLREDHYPELQEFRSGLARDPEGTRRRLIRFLNEQKFQRFHEWWNFMQTHYGEFPAVVYCVLKRIFSTSLHHTRRPVYPLDPAALSCIVSAIGTGACPPNANLLQRYLAAHFERSTGGMSYLRNGWTRINGLTEGGCPSRESIKLLTYLGSMGRWCVGNESVARAMLSQCDFFILCSDELAPEGRPVVGARVAHGVLIEAAGYANGLQPYGADIQLLGLSLLQGKPWPTNRGKAANGLVFAHALTHTTAAEWQNLLLRNPMGWDYAPPSIRLDPQIKAAVKAAAAQMLSVDPSCGAYFSRDFAGIPGFEKSHRIGWLQRLRERPLSAQEIPPELAEDEEALAAWKYAWISFLSRSAVTRVDPLLMREAGIRDAWIQGWVTDLSLRNYSEREIPSEIFSQPAVQKAWKSGWIAHLQCELGVSRERIPSLLRADEGIRQAWAYSWTRALAERTEPAPDLPHELHSDKNLFQNWRWRWLRYLEKGRYSQLIIPPILLNDSHVLSVWRRQWEKKSLNAAPDPREPADPELNRCAWRLHWVEKMTSERYPDQAISEELGSDPEIFGAWRKRWIQRLETWGLKPELFPSALWEDREVRDAWARGWTVRLSAFGRPSPKIPDALLQNPTVVKAWKGRWVEYLENEPVRHEPIPEDLAHDPDIQRAARRPPRRVPFSERARILPGERPAKRLLSDKFPSVP